MNRLARISFELLKLATLSAMLSALLLPAYALAVSAVDVFPWTSAAHSAFGLNFAVLFASLGALELLSRDDRPRDRAGARSSSSSRSAAQ